MLAISSLTLLHLLSPLYTLHDTVPELCLLEPCLNNPLDLFTAEMSNLLAEDLIRDLPQAQREQEFQFYKAPEWPPVFHLFLCKGVCYKESRQFLEIIEDYIQLIVGIYRYIIHLALKFKGLKQSVIITYTCETIKLTYSLMIFCFTIFSLYTHALVGSTHF
jgi:hypothetical protein